MAENWLATELGNIGAAFGNFSPLQMTFNATTAGDSAGKLSVTITAGIKSIRLGYNPSNGEWSATTGFGRNLDVSEGLKAQAYLGAGVSNKGLIIEGQGVLRWGPFWGVDPVKSGPIAAAGGGGQLILNWGNLNDLAVGASELGSDPAQVLGMPGSDRQWIEFITGKSVPFCFSAGTEITGFSQGDRAIESIGVGDIVASFDGDNGLGRGELRGGEVRRVFHGITDVWIELSNGLTVTPGHHFLDILGNFRAIDEILQTDSQIVLANGDLVRVEGRYIRYSTETAHLYEQAEGYVTPVVGALALAPVYKKGWKTYNFEVEDYHTYIAGGVRVHNASVFTPTGLDLTIGETYPGKDGDEYFVNKDGSLTNTTSGATSAPSTHPKELYNSVWAAERAKGESISPSDQYSMANEGAFNEWQVEGDGPSVQLSSGSTARAGTQFATGDGYVYVVNSDGSVTNINTGHTSGGDLAPGERRYNADTGQWDTGSYSSGGDDEDSDSDSGKPILIDLDGDGLEVTPLSSSNTFIDIFGDGLKHRTAWAGAGDGVLVRDHGNDGVINLANEIDFTKWDSTARSDIEALRNIFDTNHDGKLSSADTDWSLFKVLVTNADGTRTLKTLAELGIKEFSLITNNQEVVLSDGSKISGTATYTRTDNSTGTLADVSFRFDENGYLVTETVTTNGDGSKTQQTEARDTAGNLTSKTTLTTSADGLTRTLTFDDNGDGVTDRVQTIVKVIHAGGATTETVRDFDGSGTILLRRETTDTSADRKTITVSTDSTGSNTIFDRVETRVINASGTQTVTVQQRHADGSERNEVTTITSADGLSETVQTDIDGNGIVDATRVEATSVSSGARTETVTSYAGSGTTTAHRIGGVVTATSADGSSKTITSDLDGDGDTDLVIESAIVHDAGGGKTTTATTSNGNATFRGETITSLSADGHSRTVQSDLDGDGDIDRVVSDVKTFGVDGSTTQVIETEAGNGTTLNKMTATWSADGKTRNTQIDSDGDGNNDVVQTVAVVSGSSVETSSTYSPNGATLVARTVTTTSANGLSRSSQIDANGDGTYDAVRDLVTVKNANGSSTVTEQLLNGAGTTNILRKVTSTSADGLTITVEQFRNAETSPFQKAVSAKVLNASGSVTETTTAYSGSSLAQAGKTVTTVSADRLTTTVSSFVGASALPETISTIVVAASGLRTETVWQYSTDGATLLGKTVETTSSDGLTVTTVIDGDGDSDTDGTTTSVLTLNADGTTTASTTRFAGTGTAAANRAETSTVTKSGNGLSVTTQADHNGDATVDRRTTEVLAYNADGSQTRTVTSLNGAGTIQLGKTVETVSDDGLTKSVSTYLGDNTIADGTVTEATVLGADGSQVTTTTSKAANGATIGKTTVTKSGNGLTTTTAVDLDGNTINDSQVTSTTAAAGGATTTVSNTYGATGTLRSTSTVVSAATGLSTTVSTDLDGNGTTDRSSTDVITLNADGSRTRVVTTYKAAGAIEGKVTTLTSGDGLSITTTWEATGAGVTRTQTDTTVVNADGSTTRTVENRKAGSVLNDKTITITSADGTVTRTTRDINGDNVVDETIVQKKLTDGSVLTSRMDGAVASASGREYGTLRGAYTTESGSGLVRTTRYDANGDGLAELEVSDVTVLNADGTRTQTITRSTLTGGNPAAANPTYTVTLKERAVTTTSANGQSVATDWDVTGSGSFSAQRTVSTTFNADGLSTRNTRYFEAGVLKSHHEVVLTGDGLSETTSWNSDGVGTFDEVSAKSFVRNADGSSTSTVINTTFGGAPLSKIETTISADGRTVVMKEDPAGTGTFTKIKTTVTETLADGSKVVTVTDSDGGGAVVLQRSVTSTSADGRIVSVTRDADGDTTTDQTTETVRHVDGSVTSVVKDFGPTGAVTVHTVTTTSFDGRTITTEQDLDGDGIFDRRTIQTLRQFADGSTEVRTEGYQISSRSSGGTVTPITPDLDQIEIIKTSADGRTKQTTLDIFGDGTIDETTTTIQSVNGATVTTATASALARSAVVGHEIKWVSAVLANATVAAAKTVTVSPDGKTTVLADYDGNGTYEHEEVWTSRIDGAQRGLFSDKNAAGAVIATGVLSISSDGQVATLDRDNNNDGTVDYREQVVTRIDGSVVKKSYERNGSGGFDLVWTTISHANAQSLRLHGTAGDDVLIGAAGNDALFGEAGNDTLDGGGGADRLEGGLGNDIFIVDDRADQVVEGIGEGTDLVRSSVSYALAANVENLTLIGGDAINATGNSANNVLVGNGAANIIDGMGGADTMSGAAGNDTYIVDNSGDSVVELGGEGTDGVQAFVTHTLAANVENLTLTGSSAINGTGNSLNNVLTGNGAANALSGGAGNDGLTGNGGNDTLDGGDGDDSLNGGAGADALNGGTGLDIASYQNATAGVIAHTGNTALNAGEAFGDTYTAIEGLRGGGHNDELIIVGDNTRLYGGSGSDKLSTVGSGSQMFGEAGADFLYGDVGSDSLDGGWENDELFGYGGNDTLNGGAGADWMVGGSGDDTYVIDNVGDGVQEDVNCGTDLVQSFITYALGANLENLTLSGSAAINGTGNSLDNIIAGNGAANLLYGGAGNDTLNGGLGSDNMFGGIGNDTYVVESAGDAVTEAAGEGIDLVQSSISYTLGADVENLTLTGSAALNGTGNTLNNVLTGNTGANVLDGGSGNDTLNGGDGNDTLIGGLGGDALNGGSGFDFASYAAASSGVSVHTGAPGSNSGEAAGDTFSSIEGLRGSAHGDTLVLVGDGVQLYGGGSNDTLTTVGNGTQIYGEAGTDHLHGGSGVDHLEGGAEYDELYGNAGNDTLIGGTGDDWMVGGTGDDTYVVDSAADSAVESAGEGTDHILASVTYTLDPNVENLTLTGSAAINGTGNGLDNVILGNAATNTLFGAGGNDTLNGGAGTDTMVGGTGNDTYVVDNAGDVITEALNEGHDFVEASVTHTLASNVENLTLTGAGTINGTGNGLDNVLIGNAAANTLSAGAGNDTLNGGAGNDTMIGGTGNDHYYVDAVGDVVTEAAGEGTDTVHSTISHALGANVENLTLLGTANINATGNALANILTGNAGNNVFNGGGGADTYYGGDGIDTITYASATAGITFNANDDPSTYTGEAFNDFAYDIEVVIGTSFDDSMTIVDSYFTLYGGGGNDYLNAWAGDVTFYGEAGADFLWGDFGNDHLDGGAGNDTIDGYGGDDLIIGGEGADSLTGGGGFDTASYETAAAGVVVNCANMSLNTGDAAGDTFAGIEALKGSSFADTLHVIHDGAWVYGGGGNDALTSTGVSSFLYGEAGNDTITGGAGADDLVGGDGNDTLYGGNGADFLKGDAGSDTMSGGLGDDAYYVDAGTDVVIEAIGEGTDTVHTTVNHTLAANIETLVLAGTAAINGTGNGLANAIYGNIAANQINGADGDDTIHADAGDDLVQGGLGLDTMFGGDGADTMNGGDGADAMSGDAGNDTLDGGAGDDWMHGAAGDDTFVVDSGADVVQEGAGEGTDTVRSSIAYTLTTNVENLTLTGALAINGTGNGLANAITGNAAANVLSGAAGNDALSGDAGDDVLIGGAGGDTLNGGSGVDTASYQTATSSVSIDQRLSNSTFTGDAANDTFISVEVFRGSNYNDTFHITQAGATVYGGTGNDHLTGWADAMTFYGEGGDDTLWGDEGADLLDGGAGGDGIRGYGGNDTLRGGAGIDTILGGDGADTIYGGTEDDAMSGDAGDDVVYGEAGNDSLQGEGGNDILDGGLGDDWMHGAAGNDVFVFRANEGSDRITAFELHAGTTNGDVIELHGQSLNTFSALIAAATEAGGSTFLHLDGGAQIELEAISKADLTASDFRFM